MAVAIIWLLFSFLVAWLGKAYKPGFWLIFLISALLSPLVGAIVVIVSKEPVKSESKLKETNKTDYSILTPALIFLIVIAWLWARAASGQY